MRKILTVVVAVFMFALSAAALVPWRTQTTIDGVTYRGTFHFDPPAYLALDTIQWADPSNISTYYTLPETIEFNGTEFEVKYGHKADDLNAYLKIMGTTIPDTIEFKKKGYLSLYDWNGCTVRLNTVILPDSMEYIYLEADHVINYSAPILTYILAYKTLTLSDQVESVAKMETSYTVDQDRYGSYLESYPQPAYVNFKNVRVLEDKAWQDITIERVEFEGQLEIIGEEAFALRYGNGIRGMVTPKLQWLDLHDSPALLDEYCLRHQIKLRYLRSGAPEFNSKDCFGSYYDYQYSPWGKKSVSPTSISERQEYYPLDSLILTRAHKIAIYNMKPQQYIEAPCVDTLYEGSFVGGELGDLSRLLLNVKYIDEFAFRDSCIIEVMRFDGLKKIADNAFTNSRIRCFYVNDSLESIGQGIFKFGPEEVVISEGNDRFFTEDDCWFFSKKSPNTPMFHYGPMPTGEWYTPQTKYQGYKVDVSAVENIAINEDFVNIRWRFYNFGDSSVNVYINRDLEACLDIIKLFDGKFEFYVPETVYSDLMTSLGYPPGYPVPYHPYDFSAVETVVDDMENGPVEYFDLNGLRVDPERLTPGLYIRRQGAKTEKVVVK